MCSSDLDQWINFFTSHLGRWLNNYAFEKMVKAKYGFGTPNQATQDEALKFTNEQLPVIEAQLSTNKYLAGDSISIADYIAYSHFENAEMAGISLDEYSALAAWYVDIKRSDEIKRGHKKLGLT